MDQGMIRFSSSVNTPDDIIWPERGKMDLVG